MPFGRAIHLVHATVEDGCTLVGQKILAEVLQTKRDGLPFRRAEVLLCKCLALVNALQPLSLRQVEQDGLLEQFKVCGAARVQHIEGHPILGRIWWRQRGWRGLEGGGRVEVGHLACK
ncbi:hypothetical protein OU995_25930 [Roseateles sp. SL47]|uniref:hypothetical protein n=1 Tax=Roseateles sp. SL47 TaxID=2995138 RepID=UPI0022721B44|nr:hypothetical protein [Roseateles sp. SL47]WAC72911.1 hypothetical protein OU995_25930 [Roseateles sp. SL47]